MWSDLGGRQCIPSSILYSQLYCSGAWAVLESHLDTAIVGVVIILLISLNRNRSSTVPSLLPHFPLMDPASVITTILSSAISINKWVEDTKKKEVAINQLSTTVNLVYLTLSPLEVGSNSQNLTPPIIASLVSLGAVLSRIKDHLDVWADKTIKLSKLMGFLTPSSVLEDLRDDSELLQQHLLAVSFALHLSTVLQDKSKDAPVKGPSPVDLMKSSQAREFWHAMMGDRVNS